eukprot:scaffold889_cov268-Pinguiococcus_pyrenoidosus.AAC.4
MEQRSNHVVGRNSSARHLMICIGRAAGRSHFRRVLALLSEATEDHGGHRKAIEAKNAFI